MNYTEFKEYVTKKLEEYYKDAEIIINTVHKNQETLDGISVRVSNSAVSPTVYLNGFYEEYEAGRETLEEIIDKIIMLNNDTDKPEIDVKSITLLENVKDRILPRVVGIDGNEEYLKDKPYIRFADSLAVIFYIDLTKDDTCNMSTCISDALLKGYGVTLLELNEIALANLNKDKPVLKDMNEVIRDLMVEKLMTQFGCDREDALCDVDKMGLPVSSGLMYVLSNKSTHYGASVILNEEFMNQVSEKLGGNYFIIPSSVHECILIPAYDLSHSTSDLEEMIKSVNSSEVQPQDKLSDHLFYFDSKDRIVKRCYTDTVVATAEDSEAAPTSSICAS